MELKDFLRKYSLEKGGRVQYFGALVEIDDRGVPGKTQIFADGKSQTCQMLLNELTRSYSSMGNLHWIRW